MKATAILACAALTMLATVSTGFAGSGGRLHGTISTVDGDTYEGLIRWDKNEASWHDILNGNKEIHRSRRSVNRHERITVFGITIGNRWYREDDGDGAVQSGICFGHIAKIEPLRGDAARSCCA